MKAIIPNLSVESCQDAVEFELQETFWGVLFAVVIDKFAIS